MAFLPNDYEMPASGGNYLKFQVGDNRFRVLGPAVVGNEFWVTDGDGSRRPVRRRVDQDIEPDELGVDQYGKRERPKHFWAFPVWNVSAQRVQICEITQRTIQEAIRSFVESEDWGDPTGYDLNVKKSGTKLDTEYTVIPGRPSPIPDNVRAEYDKLRLDLNLLFEGLDPFKDSNGNGRAPQANQSPYQQARNADPVETLPDEGTTIRTIKRVEPRGDIYVLHTDLCPFYTADAALGQQAHEFVGNGECVIGFKTTARGNKEAVGISDSVGDGDDTEIPF